MWNLSVATWFRKFFFNVSFINIITKAWLLLISAPGSVDTIQCYNYVNLWVVVFCSVRENRNRQGSRSKKCRIACSTGNEILNPSFHNCKRLSNRLNHYREIASWPLTEMNMLMCDLLPNRSRWWSHFQLTCKDCRGHTLWQILKVLALVECEMLKK